MTFDWAPGNWWAISWTSRSRNCCIVSTASFDWALETAATSPSTSAILAHEEPLAIAIPLILRDARLRCLEQNVNPRSQRYHALHHRRAASRDLHRGHNAAALDRDLQAAGAAHLDALVDGDRERPVAAVE